MLSRTAANQAHQDMHKSLTTKGRLERRFLLKCELFTEHTRQLNRLLGLNNSKKPQILSHRM